MRNENWNVKEGEEEGNDEQPWCVPLKKTKTTWSLLSNWQVFGKENHLCWTIASISN
jgi:hypothetical protein